MAWVASPNAIAIQFIQMEACVILWMVNAPVSLVGPEKTAPNVSCCMLNKRRLDWGRMEWSGVGWSGMEWNGVG